MDGAIPGRSIAGMGTAGKRFLSPSQVHRVATDPASRGPGVERGARAWHGTMGHRSRRPGGLARRATMLVNPKAELARARREGWALGGFNVFNLESARAVIAAGEELAAPLLVQTSEG